MDHILTDPSIQQTFTKHLHVQGKSGDLPIRSVPYQNSCHKGIRNVILSLATPLGNTAGEVEHFSAEYIPGEVRALLSIPHFMTDEETHNFFV